LLSRIASQHAAEIRNHDWSDAPWRADRAGHDRKADSKASSHEPLNARETDTVRLNAMWVTAQVLAYNDPNFDVVEFAAECGCKLDEGGLRAGLRSRDGKFQRPGTWEFDPEPE
jgi:hypothetical protein